MPDRDPRRVRQQRLLSKRFGGWGGTGLQWHPQLGPINPRADQPAPRQPSVMPAANPRVQRLSQLWRTARKLQSGQRSPGNGYRKTVGRSITITRPAQGARRA